ncbi:penicillin acylase family protein [Pseudoduganella sp. LjRoot289]|uniref:penicillin acylase family protein n=1 Tax=Pseudoduganella sp. LjRoot289 TaxID=3342314 RepID=UPI003ECFB635
MMTQALWVLAASALTAGALAAPVSSEVTRTSYGVVHVKAADFRSLGYGLAHAYAEDNICMLADTLLTVRGERSRYFGPDAKATKPKNGEYGAALEYVNLRNEDSDFFFKGYLDIEQLRAGYAASTQEVRDVLAGYVAGYNRYLRDSVSRLPAACRGAAWVKPMSVDDLYLLIAEKALHATGEVFADAIVAAARDSSATVALAKSVPLASRKLPMGMPAGLGSNGLAIGKEASANGRGILLGNPHYPWTSADRFYQIHLTVPGKYDAMGASLGGMPAVVIGFNQNLAWTHTVTKAIHFTTFALALDPSDPSGTTYFYDGEALKMSSRTVAVESLQVDGTLTTRQKTFYFSRQGAVIVMPGVEWTASSAIVLADANRNNTRLVEQWLAMGKANSVGALKESMNALAGLPWVNTVAADRDGNTLYMDGSAVPNMGTDKFASDCLVVPELFGFDGTRSACAWGKDEGTPDGVFGGANMPMLERQDYVGNSNDSYWLSNVRHLLSGPAPYGYSPLYGSTDVEQTLRTRIGFKQLEAALAEQRHLDADDVQRLMFANRVHAAELILPELVPACLASNDRGLLLACSVLMTWDRKADLDSRGAVLFREFWNAAAGIPGKWKVPFDAADPVNTPRGLAPAAKPAMLQALRAAVDKLNAQGVPLYGRLGDYQTETRNGKRYQLHGAIGDIDGSYNSINMASDLTPTGYRDVAWGTSYLQVVGFDRVGPVAKGLLVYGQSVDPKSAHYADQLPLYSRKTLARLPFTDDQIRSDPAYQRKVLSEN